MNSRISISEIVANSRLGTYQIMVLVLCFMSMVIDGFDIQSMAFVAPAIIEDWDISKSSLGPVFSVGLVGMLLGSLWFGSLADKIGRRPILISAQFILALTMLATAYTQTVEALLAIRLLSGLAMGAIVPNVFALSTEYAPQKNRATLLMLISSGMVIGGILGGIIASILMPKFGWHSMFYVGAFAPLVMAIAMFALLPESMQWQIAKGQHISRVLKTLKRISPQLLNHDIQGLAEPDKTMRSLSVKDLFSASLRCGTTLLWLMNFMNMLCGYFLASWIPVLMSDAGHSGPEAAMAGMSMWGGGLAGSLMLGWFVDRFGYTRVLIPTLISSGLAIVLFSEYYVAIKAACLFIAIAGFGLLGSQAILNAMISTYYPTSLRSTGLGWSLASGRLGGIAGPFLGGSLLALQWDTAQLLLLSALPVGITVLAIMLFSKAKTLIVLP